MKVIPVDIGWHPGLPVYASEAFLRTVSDEYGWIGGNDNSGRLRCVLPYTVIRKAGLRMVRFRVATIPLDRELDVGEERVFLNSAMEYLRYTGSDIIIPGANSAVFRTYPEGAMVAPYGTVINDLTQTEDMLWRGISADFRNKVRKATKAGVRIQSGIEHLECAYDLVEETLKRSDVTFRTYDEFKRIVLALGENVRIFVAERDGIVQACLVSPFSAYAAYSWYTATRSEPVTGAMHLLQWEAMRQFRDMGVESFNFQGVRICPQKGSKQDGILNFKMRFGGTLVQGYVWKYSLDRLKATAYSVAVRLLKGGDIVDQEHHKLADEQALSIA